MIGRLKCQSSLDGNCRVIIWYQSPSCTPPRTHKWLIINTHSIWKQTRRKTWGKLWNIFSPIAQVTHSVFPAKSHSDHMLRSCLDWRRQRRLSQGDTKKRGGPLEKQSSEGFHEFSLLFIIFAPKYLLMGQWLPSCVCTCVRMHVPVLIVTLSCALLAVFLLLAVFPRLWDS